MVRLALVAAIWVASRDGGAPAVPDAGDAGAALLLDAGCDPLSDEDRAVAEDLDLLRDLELLKLYELLAPEP
jgi:hypothetical protein